VRLLASASVLKTPAEDDSSRSVASVASVVKAIAQAYDASQQAGSALLFFVKPSGEFYAVRNCRTRFVIYDEYCDDPRNTARMLAFVQHKQLYGDANTRVFQLSDSGDILARLITATGSDPYPSAIWAVFDNYGINAEWKFSPGLLRSIPSMYVEPVRAAVNGNVLGVAGATRFAVVASTTSDKRVQANLPWLLFPDNVQAVEPCDNQCRSSSYAVRATQEFATKPVAFMTNSTDDAQAIKLLWDSWKASDHLDNVRLMYASASTGDYYALESCWLPTNWNRGFCAFTSNWAIAYVQKRRQNLPNVTYVFSVDHAGTLQGSFGYSGDFLDTLAVEVGLSSSGLSTGTSFSIDVSLETLASPYDNLNSLTPYTRLGAGVTRALDDVVFKAKFPTEFGRIVATAYIRGRYGIPVGVMDSILLSLLELQTGVITGASLPTVEQARSLMENVTIAYANKTGLVISVRSDGVAAVPDVRPTFLKTVQTLVALRMSTTILPDASQTLRQLFRADGGVLSPVRDGNGDKRLENWFKINRGWSGGFDLQGFDGRSRSATDPLALQNPIRSVASTYSLPLGVTASTVLGDAVVAAVRTSEEMCVPGEDQDVPSIRTRVKNLDTMATVAARFDYTWHSLLLLNPGLRNPDKLAAKNILYHSMLYVVRAGDTVYSIAKKYGITWKQLIDQNPQIPQTKAKLDWREIPSGECYQGVCFPYYYNLQTKQVQWEKPAEVSQAEQLDQKIYVGEKLAIRPNLELLVCNNQYYTASAVHVFSPPGQ